MLKQLYLIGFMGCGKSTVGRYLQEEHDLSFVDTDTFIEETHGKEISEIFATGGEQLFRKIEIEALRSLNNVEIVSTGGGIVERKENQITMEKNGFIVYLETSFEEIVSRLQADTTRPLWNQNLKKREQLYERRNTLYLSFADAVIQTDAMTVEEIGEKIMKIRREE